MTTKTFVSYATKYDMYDGFKDWSELSINEQDEIIRTELSKTDTDHEELIMSTGLIKKQAQGLRSIFVTVSILLERYKLIQDIDDWSVPQRDLIINFLKGTALSKRISQTFDDTDDEGRQAIDGKELASVSGTELDVLLDMEFQEAKNFFLEEFENLPYVVQTVAMPKNIGTEPVSCLITPENLILKDVCDCLEKLFNSSLKAKGIFPTVVQTPDFPFPDYKTTVLALRSGKAYLSFGLMSPIAFNAISTKAEKFLNKVGMLAYWLAAPIALVAGAVISENYWLLLWSVLLFPLAFFGTHPHYKKAPLFLMGSMTCVFLGINEESAALVSVGAFFAIAIGGYSFTRRLYNLVLIGRSLEMESALMFLLGCNYLHLCGEKSTSLWTPAWIKAEEKLLNMERMEAESEEMMADWGKIWDKK